MREIVLDTETTGLDPATGDRVVEIGAVELLNGVPTGENFHVYINPERDMPEGAFRVHGLSAEFLSGHPVFSSIAKGFLDFIAGDRLVIHNAEFDVKFINAEFARLDISPLAPERIVDTLALARRKHPSAANSLDALCARYGVDSSRRKKHGALLDAELLADVYIGLTRGQETLLIEPGDEGPGHAQHGAVRIDLRQFDLPVIAPSEAERAAHEKILAELDKASGGRTLWPRPAAPNPENLVA